ncbi:MAG: septum formation protein Maf [Clostridia bacterium]|nr:septum formation protein Maf [Clostridia bacterium]
MIGKSILLASASPRRREILETAGIPFTVVPSFGEEICPQGLSVEEVVAENAKAKALEVSSRFPGQIVLGADTLVEYGGTKLGKPKDRAHAAEMLRFLSGKTHRVLTGVCITDGTNTKTEVSVSQVTFRTLSEELITAYVATGECDDKAGAYGIQGKGCILVEKIEGDYFSIVGLPICTVYKMLEEF